MFTWTDPEKPKMGETFTSHTLQLKAKDVGIEASVMRGYQEKYSKQR